MDLDPEDTATSTMQDVQQVYIHHFTPLGQQNGYVGLMGFQPLVQFQDDSNTTSLSATAHVKYESISDAAAVYSDRLVVSHVDQSDDPVNEVGFANRLSAAGFDGNVERSATTIGPESGYQINDGIMEISDVDDGVVEVQKPQHGPSRKAKKNQAMTKEQDEARILQLKAALEKFNAETPTTVFNPTIENAPVATIPHRESHENTSSIAWSDINKASSVASKAANGAGKIGRSRRAMQSKYARRPPKSMEQKQHERNLTKRLSQGALSTVQRLQKLGKPFERDLACIVIFAGETLDKQPESAALIEEILGMEQEWKAYHEDKLKKMTGLLERAGVVPMGGVEAIVDK